MPHCDCPTLCKGGKDVTDKTYRQHATYRTSRVLSAAFNEFIASETTARLQQAGTAADLGSAQEGDAGQEQPYESDDDLYLDYDFDLDAEMNPSRTNSPASEHASERPETPPCDLDHVPIPGDYAPPPPPPASRIEDIRTSLQFIDHIKAARLEDSHLDADDIHRLRNPTPMPTEILDDPHLRLSLDVFLACTNSSQDTYEAIRSAVTRCYPESKMLSFDQVKRCIKHITGIVPLYHDMCINTCLAFTGPFENLDTCPMCKEPRYEKKTPTHDPHDSDDELDNEEGKVPRRQFSTLPLGPQLQAAWRNPENAEAMRYRERRTNQILETLRINGGSLDIYDDFCCGSDYLHAVQTQQIEPNDTVVLFSIDGAQLYRNKKSDCWIYIWVILNLAPDKRYKVKHVLPGGFIGGPNHPKNRDSFLSPGFHHVSALQREGLIVWDGSRQSQLMSNIFIAFLTSDCVALADMIGWVGHHGKFGCRFQCGLPGRHKPGGHGTHYYPAMMKPHNYDAPGCDHPDIDVNNLPTASPQTYRQNLERVVHSPNQTQYALRRRECGICKPSIVDGLHRTLPIPNCFPGDVMHHTGLNIPDIKLSLFRNVIDCDRTDDKSTWDWATLQGDIWKQHGQAVAAAAQYIPSHYGRTPRNPAEKISSGYKASEFLIYIYGLGPGLLYRILPMPYWQHFCKLVCGVRLLLQRSISKSDLVLAHRYLLEYAVEFEALYCQRRADRLHFVRQSIHCLTHFAPETLRVGPLALLAQWVMERTIGNLGLELRQPSNPYANLSQRGLLRSQINALKAMFPDLEPDKTTIPHGSLDIGDGYILLRKRDKSAYSVRQCEALAIRAYLERTFGELVPGRWTGTVIRWARLSLPNGQTARSLWSKASVKRTPRRTRNITVTIDEAIRVGEVLFYFSISVEQNRKWVALISLFDPVDPDLYKVSHGALAVSKYRGDNNLVVVDIKSIRSSISMVPLPPPEGPIGLDCDLFFSFEDLGYDVAEMDIDVD